MERVQQHTYTEVDLQLQHTYAYVDWLLQHCLRFVLSVLQYLFISVAIFEVNFALTSTVNFKEMWIL